MDDYVHLFMSYLTHLPLLTLTSPQLSQATYFAISSLTLPAPETTLSSLEVLALLSKRLSNPQSQYQTLIQPVFTQYGKAMIVVLIRGLVAGFPEEAVEGVHEVLKGICGVGGWEAKEWIKEGLLGLGTGGGSVPVAEQEKFMQVVHE
jgi:transportin-3